jgi:hypothetical protein
VIDIEEYMYRLYCVLHMPCEMVNWQS